MDSNNTQLNECTCVEDYQCGFLSRFAGKAFSTFDAFSKELQAHEEETGMQYMMKRTCLFNEGTLGREYLVYRYMHFVCVRHIKPAKKMSQGPGGTKCPAYFSVGTRKHKLFVRQYDMHHNHPAHMEPIVKESPVHRLPFTVSTNPQLEAAVSCCACSDTVQDCTADFLRLFPSMSFFSFVELQAKMDDFQIATGNRYVKTNTRLLPHGSPTASVLVYSHLVYVCYRYGTKVSEAKQRRLQRTAKIGCRSKIYFYSQDNQLHVRRYDLRHNHEVRPDLVNFPPKKRRSRREKEELTRKSSPRETERNTHSLDSSRGDPRPPLSEIDPAAFEEVEFDEEDDTSHQIYLQTNRYDQQQHLLGGDFRAVFPVHDFDAHLHQHPFRGEPSPLTVSHSHYQVYPQLQPRNSAIPPNEEGQKIDLTTDEIEENETFDESSQSYSPRWSLTRSLQHRTPPLDEMCPLLRPHLQKISELATSCGPVWFANRLKDLKALEEKWLRENEHLIKRRDFL